MAKQDYANLRWRVAQAAEIRWWRQYLRRQPAEVYLAQKAAYWRRLMDDLGMVFHPGERLLDAGCGPAGIFMVLEGAEVTAVDPLLGRYRELPHFDPGDYPFVEFRELALEELSDCAEYEQVFCLNAINHVADLEGSLRGLRRALRPGGRAWISVDVHRFRWLQPVFRVLPGDVLHPHQFTLEQYRGLLLRAGFRVEGEWRLKPGGIFEYWMFLAVG